MPTTPLSMSRRGLINVGGGALAGVAVGGLALPAAPALATAAPAASAALLPGQPARNRIYYGSIISSTTSVSAFERQLGHRLGSRRNYHQPTDVAALLRRAREDVAAGRFSVLSIKPPGTWKSVAKGNHNAWLNQMLDGLAALDAPLCLTINHEPENDTRGHGSGMTPYWHRRMIQRLVRKAANRAPKVNVIQILMAWTFHPKCKRNPEKWLANNVKMFGIDAYNWWSPENPSAKKWEEFGDMLDRVKKYSGDKPLVVAEYGTRTDPDRPGRAAQWMRSAYKYALANNVIAMEYFNTAPKGIKEPFILDSERLEAFKECLYDARSISLRT